MLDTEIIRRNFPILERQVYGKPLVYLDNAATTQKPVCVVDKIAEGYYHTNANVHRGVHFLSQEATEAHEQARRKVQQFIGAEHAHEIIFTRGTTEAINLVVSSYGEEFLKEGDEVIISQMEHHANIVPWQLLQNRKKIVLKVVPVLDNGELDMEAYRNIFSEKTRLVSLTHVSNVLGTINPVKEIIAEAHKREVPVMIDGAQAVPHSAVDVKDLDVDFYVFSAHKMYGPTGIGVLYGKEKWLEKMPPYQGGGEMIGHVSFEKTTFNELPYKFEAGTPDYIGTTAFATALDYISSVGIDRIEVHENELLRYATNRLLEIENIRIFGTAPHKSSVISFQVGDIHHYDMGMLLDKLGIAVRTGHHCAQPLMERLGVEGTVRASFAMYNTKEEADAFVAAVKRVSQMF
ncbi:aminotransferase class V-fold PLP-dependent enzyme [Coprobacter tertius]|uniref:Cysteine desulfurase n=1 Tax=Coprobacter tertius TaxID=2944915 RepID=A0ABT1MLJ8_9BACT|nr:cysteine desulfurase [Coprobacter tertius]MCP9612593.1 cysteine desulfurase [Coprobacter tertius]